MYCLAKVANHVNFVCVDNVSLALHCVKCFITSIIIDLGRRATKYMCCMFRLFIHPSSIIKQCSSGRGSRSYVLTIINSWMLCVLST